MDIICLKWSCTSSHQQWQPTLVLLPGKSHGWRSLVGCSPWGREESDTTERFHFQFSLSCIAEGNGNPLQHSCLENLRDGRAWWAVVYGVAESRTRLKRLSSSSRWFCVQTFVWTKLVMAALHSDSEWKSRFCFALWGGTEHTCLWVQLRCNTLSRRVRRKSVLSLFEVVVTFEEVHSTLHSATVPAPWLPGRTAACSGRADGWRWCLPVLSETGDRNWLFPVYLSTHSQSRIYPLMEQLLKISFQGLWDFSIGQILSTRHFLLYF